MMLCFTVFPLIEIFIQIIALVIIFYTISAILYCPCCFLMEHNIEYVYSAVMFTRNHYSIFTHTFDRIPPCVHSEYTDRVQIIKQTRECIFFAFSQLFTLFLLAQWLSVLRFDKPYGNRANCSRPNWMFTTVNLQKRTHLAGLVRRFAESHFRTFLSIICVVAELYIAQMAPAVWLINAATAVALWLNATVFFLRIFFSRFSSASKYHTHSQRFSLIDVLSVTSCHYFAFIIQRNTRL